MGINFKEQDKKYLWHPFTQMKDWCEEDFPVIESGEGCTLIDTEGRRYIDGVSSLWCNIHGHRKAEIDRAIKAQIDKISHATFLGLSNIPASHLAEKLVQISPEGLEKVFYSNSGSEAVEVALKMGYQYWQQVGGEANKKRTKYLHLTESYHGDTLGAVSVGGIDLFHKVYKPFLFETVSVRCPYYYRFGEGQTEEEYLKGCLGEFEETVAKHHEELIGVIMEPVMLGAAGMLKQPRGYIRGVREITKKYGILLIFDEVATGFGRTGKMFAADTENVSPDLMAIGKGMTGGYLPLSATLATNEIYEAFLGEYEELKTFFHGHTYTGNPLATAAAIANLEIFKNEKTLEKLEEKITFLGEKLEAFRELDHVGDIRQAGFMVGIELVKDKATKEPFDWKEKKGIQVTLKARERGVIIRPLGNVIVLMPPLSMEKELLVELIKVVFWAVRECTNKKTVTAGPL